MSDDSYHNLERRIVRWCPTRPDIQAAIVIGSRGRQPHDADSLSDLDLIFFTLNARQYQEDNTWLKVFGEAWISSLNFIGSGDPEWMAYFSPGLKVDFLFVNAAAGQSIGDMLQALPYQQVLERGFRLIYRAEAHADEAVDTSAWTISRTLPSEHEFHRRLSNSLFTADRFVKFSLRNDLWRCQYTYNAELKNHLLALVEWHAQTTASPTPDLWYDGRNMGAWADERVLAALPRLTPGDELAQHRDALILFFDLLDVLAAETAERLGFTYPGAGQRQMIDHLKMVMGSAVGR